MIPTPREVASFSIVGLIQLLVDWTTFVLLSFLGLPVIPANISGRVVGALLGYSLNGIFTFSRPDGAAALGRVQFLRFLATWIVMAFVSTLCVTSLNSYVGLHAAWMGKPVIDAILAGASFLASKYWIYR